MTSKKPFFNIDFVGKLWLTFLIGALCFFSNPVSSQNTKGDRPILSPGPIRENSGRQTKFRNNRTSNRSGRSVNPRKSGILKNLTDRKSPGSPAGERASVSPKRISPPRTASQTGRVAEQVVKPYVNSSSYSPPASQKVDRSGRTASGRRLVTRQPSRSVNIYEWSGPKPRQVAPERAGEEKAYSGNRTASGKKIVERKPTGQSRNLYLGSQKFVVNPSPKPQPSENFSSRSFRAQRTSRANEGSASNQSGITSRSASRSFVTPAKNNVYWGKFSPQRGKISTDMYGRPLRRKDYQTSAKEILPSDTVPGANRQTRRTESTSEKEKANRTASKSGIAWQGDISGKKLRASAADPRRNGPAQLAKQQLNIGELSGKNNQKRSGEPGIAAGAGALMKAGAKGYLKNSVGAGLRAGKTLSQINKLGMNGLTKGNIRMSARYNGGLNKQGSGMNRADLNKTGGSFSAGRMKPAYGGRPSGGNLELFGKKGEGLLKKNYAASKANSGKIYGLSGGIAKSKGRIDLAALSSGSVRSGFQAGGLKRSAIGVVRVHGKNRTMDSGPSLKVRNTTNERYQKFASARRPGMESGNLRRTTNGAVRSSNGYSRYAVKGMNQFQKNRSGIYSGVGAVRRSGFEAGSFKRNTIGMVQVYGNGYRDLSGKGIFKNGDPNKIGLNGSKEGRRLGFEPGGSGRTTIGSVKVFGNRNDGLDGTGLYKSQSFGSGSFDRVGSIQRSGFQSGGLKRSTIGSVRIGNSYNDKYDRRMIRNQQAGQVNLNGIGSIRRGSSAAANGKRVSIGVINRPGNNSSAINGSGLYRKQGSNNIQYRDFPAAQGSGFQKTTIGRTAIGVIRLPGKNNFASSQGLFRSKNADRSAYIGGGSIQRPGFQSTSNQRSTIGTAFAPGKKSYEATSRLNSRNAFQLQAGDFRRLNSYQRAGRPGDGINRIGLNIRTSSSANAKEFPLRQKGTGNHRANVDKYSQLNLSNYGGGSFFNAGSGSPLLRPEKAQRQQLEVRNKTENRKPVNVGLNGKNLMARSNSNMGSPAGYVVKIRPGNNQKRAVLKNLPYKTPPVGTSSTGVSERYNYRLPGMVSSRDWYSQPLKFQFSDYKVNRKMATNVNPDKRFAHQKESQTEEVITIKTRMLMLFSKSGDRNETKSSSGKEKQRKPGYDPREAKIWYD